MIRQQSSRICILTGLCLMTYGCGAENPGEASKAPQLQGAILIVLDTVRADHVSCYGHDRPTTPALDGLADAGVRFEQVVSNSPWTLPAVVGLLTGEYPRRTFRERMSRSLVEVFQRAGLATGASTEGGFVSRHFGLDLGFDHFEEEEGNVQLWIEDREPEPDPEGGIEHTFDRARKWLAVHRDERFFLFIHSYEPHTPYESGRFTEDMDSGVVGPVFTIDFLQRLQSGQVTLNDAEVEYAKALYDGDLRTADHHVGKFLDSLEGLGLRERTLVVVTSDHGEELNDHYPSRTGDHGHSLRDSQLLVPLIVHDPTRRFGVRQVAAQVRLLDVIPTMADLLGVSIGRPLDGRSLVPLMTGEEKHDRVAISGQTRSGPQRTSLRSMGFKYIVTLRPETGKHPPLVPVPPPVQLYDLEADPGEHHNLVSEKPELALALDELLQERFGAVLRDEGLELPDAVDPGLVERLKSLGYVAQ